MSDSPATSLAVLTLSEVAGVLRCSPRTIRRAVQAGSLRALYLVPGGAPRFSRAEVQALIEGAPATEHNSHLGAWHRIRTG